MDSKVKLRLCYAEKIKKDLIKLRSRMWERMSDAQKKQYCQDEIISLENITSFFNEHSGRIKEEINKPDFEALFDERIKMKITCFDNFWEELDNGK